MELMQLRLENFKIFKKAAIDFRPLTLLAGTNSSGKSTILNAITATLQSQAPHLYPFEFVPNSKGCSLGSYRDIAHGRNTKTKFSVGLTLGRRGDQILIDGRYRYSPSGDQILPDKLSYKSKGDGIDLVWRGQKLGYRAIIHVESYNERLDEEYMGALKNLFYSIELSASKKRKTPTGKGERQRRVERIEQMFTKQEAKWFSLKGRNPNEIINELRQRHVGQQMVNAIQKSLEELFAQFTYIGPVRVRPSRYYLTTDSEQEIDTAGTTSISILHDWKKYHPRKYQEVTKSIKVLELASKLETTGSLDEILTFEVQPFHHSEKVSFADVGFGISQILPILIADTALPKGGTLLVNQPEVHLHPSSQALLANYFGSKLNTRRYVLETHSEYLINRLRLLIVQEKISADDVSIVFIESERTRSNNPKIHSIEIKKDGSLKGAPKSFFATYYLDTFDIAMGRFSDGS